MANSFVSVLCLLGLSFALVDSLPEISPEPLKIAAFNIRVFGLKKLRRTEVKNTLVQIAQRYDLVVVQEIRDSSSTALTLLKDEVNKLSPLAPFDAVVSERLGRSSSKEQYGFLFRPSRIALTGVYQFEDSTGDGTDVFEREPFAARFHCTFTELQDFAVIATHVAPNDAVAEVDALTSVYHQVVDHWNLQAVLLAGDFNADCSYLRGAKWKHVSLRTDEKFHWLIPDSEDTTVSHSDCSYDRFVTASGDILTNLVPGSVGVYRFDTDLQLSYEEALDVSDHYPIELQLRAKVNKKFQATHRSAISFVVSSDDPVTDVNDVRQIYRKRKRWLNTQVFYDRSRMQHVTATIPDVRDVMEKLLKFSKTFPRVLSEDLLAVVDAYLVTPQFTTNVFINGLDIKSTHRYDVTVTCRLRSPYTCEVKVTKFLT